jgi:hypothetical protein
MHQPVFFQPATLPKAFNISQPGNVNSYLTRLT